MLLQFAGRSFSLQHTSSWVNLMSQLEKIGSFWGSGCVIHCSKMNLIISVRAFWKAERLGSIAPIVRHSGFLRGWALGFCHSHCQTFRYDEYATRLFWMFICRISCSVWFRRNFRNENFGRKQVAVRKLASFPVSTICIIVRSLPKSILWIVNFLRRLLSLR